MKLDRNTNPGRKGKYALVKLRSLFAIQDGSPLRAVLSFALASLGAVGLIDYGDERDSEFFVIRLKDKYAGPALQAYADAARREEPEWADEVEHLAQKAFMHPNRQKPT